jgi:hypothetical protein
VLAWPVGTLVCGVTIVGGAILAVAGNKAYDKHVYPPRPPQSPTGAPTAPSNPPLQPGTPPNAPQGPAGPPPPIGTMPCPEGYVSIDGACVPITQPGSDGVDNP